MGWNPKFPHRVLYRHYRIDTLSRRSVLVQEPVLDQKLTAVVSIVVIKLFYIESQRKSLCLSIIETQSNAKLLYLKKSDILLIGGL